MTKEDFTLGMKTERMTDIGLAFKQTGAILAAIELELFTRISNGAGTVDEIAAARPPGAGERARTLCPAPSLPMPALRARGSLSEGTELRSPLLSGEAEDDATPPPRSATSMSADLPHASGAAGSVLRGIAGRKKAR